MEDLFALAPGTDSNIVGIAETAHGWLLVDSAGQVFNGGDAGFYGSLRGQRLAAPIVGIAATSDDGGYWLVAADGGVFSFGAANFYGSTGNLHLNAPVVGMAATGDGGGYWLAAADGGIFSFGDAPFLGSQGGAHLNRPIVGIVAECCNTSDLPAHQRMSGPGNP